MELTNSNIVEDLKRWEKAFFTEFSQKNRLENTIAQYHRVIERFIEYSRSVQDEVTLKTINSLVIVNFFTFLENIPTLRRNNKKNGKILTNATKKNYINILRAFFTYIEENNDEIHSFSKIFHKLKFNSFEKQEEKISYLNEQEIQKLLTYLDNIYLKNGKTIRIRNVLLIKLMLFAGLRVTEALNVRLVDFSINEASKIYQIRLPMAKGGKEQIAYISARHIQLELEALKTIYDPYEFIMVSENKNHLARENAYLIVNAIYKKAGINKKGCHILRHTLAMRLTEEGVSLATVKKILRHSNISTTTIYAKATAKRVGEALEKI